MKLVKVNDVYYNFDQVVKIRKADRYYQIIFSNNELLYLTEQDYKKVLEQIIEKEDKKKK